MANFIQPKVKQILSPVIILIKPQLGQNIGAVARAMHNFNCTDLRIVTPRDGWPNQSAVAASSGAGIILDNAKIYNSTLDSCADLNYIFATTARIRGLTKNIYSPSESMKLSLSIIKDGGKVGILFGPEKSGLDNKDISRSRSIISVPISEDFASLNIAQCVVIITYEWFKLQKFKKAKIKFKRKTRLATEAEVNHLKETLRLRLDEGNYFWPEKRRSSLLQNLNNLLSRIPFTEADVRTFHGVIKSLNKK